MAEEMGRLYVVDVWADHPEHMTLRAERVVREASLIVTEEEASTQAFLKSCGSRAPLLEFRGSALLDAQAQLLAALETGDVAWVGASVAERSDAAHELLRALVYEGIDVIPVPGPSSTVTAVVMSGLPAARFTYLGAMPPSQLERRQFLDYVAAERLTLVFTVGAHDVIDALWDIREVLGDRRLVVHSDRSVWRSETSAAAALPESGWVTVIVEGAKGDASWTEDRVRGEVRALLVAGTSPRDVARDVALRSGWARRTVYAIAVDLVGKGSGE